MVLLNLVQQVHEKLLRVLLPGAAKLRVVLAHNLIKYWKTVLENEVAQPA